MAKPKLTGLALAQTGIPQALIDHGILSRSQAQFGNVMPEVPLCPAEGARYTSPTSVAWGLHPPQRACSWVEEGNPTSKANYRSDPLRPLPGNRIIPVIRGTCKLRLISAWLLLSL